MTTDDFKETFFPRVRPNRQWFIYSGPFDVPAQILKHFGTQKIAVRRMTDEQVDRNLLH